MHFQRFEKLGVELSLLGFGCMRFPTKDKQIEREEATAMLEYAYEHGVNYFDTAWGYHRQESQSFLGDVMSAYPRDSFYLATKMPVWLCNQPSDYDELFAEQQSRCRTDYFDFYLMHALNQDRFSQIQEQRGLEWLAELKKSGKATHVGFSFHGENEVFPQILDSFDWDFVQIQHNYFDNVHLNSGVLHRELTQRGIPAVIMEPVRGGLLATVPETIASILKAAAPDRSMAAWALQWVGAQPNIMVTLSGMSTLEQVKENVAVFSQENFKLTDAEEAAVTQAVAQLLSYEMVDCTACRYCMPCPEGVNIPGMFAMYNRYQMFKNAALAVGEYFGPFLDRSTRADVCTSCGTCLSECPQSIEIPQRLAELHETMSSLRGA
ncbi:MAG: aldo/keto reductase [Propionibacteriaceae bacterium]|nr:aldo/keto reductase [Propionibacteriaceae bacterium]